MAARFGAKSADYARRALNAAAGTTSWIGIQATDGLKPKDDEPDAPTLATVAAVHEYGSPRVGIPQRSYLRSTADAEGKAWLRALRAALLAYAKGDDAGYLQRVRLLGTVATGNVRRTIDRRISPPLSPVTVAMRRKGNAKNAQGDVAEDVPLKDTGQLYGSIRAQAATVAGRILTG